MVFLFKIACFKNSWKKSFFCWFMCKQHCKLYSKVGSFNHKNMLLNHKHLPPQPSNPFLPPYKLHIYILVEDLDTHWLIWNQEKRERTWNIKFLWSFWLIFYDWFFKQKYFSDVCRPYPGQLMLKIYSLNCFMQHLLLLIKTKFQRATIDQLSVLIVQQLCSTV